MIGYRRNNRGEPGSATEYSRLDDWVGGVEPSVSRGDQAFDDMTVLRLTGRYVKSNQAATRLEKRDVFAFDKYLLDVLSFQEFSEMAVCTHRTEQPIDGGTRVGKGAPVAEMSQPLIFVDGSRH
jgi:hypothetical protein